MADRYEYEREDPYRAERHRARESERWRSERPEERGFMDRASDEVRSWFGDDDAARRRQRDEIRDDYYRRDYGDRGSFRDYSRESGRGYSSYGTERGYAPGEDVTRYPRSTSTATTDWSRRDIGRPDYTWRASEGFRGRGQDYDFDRYGAERYIPYSYSYTAWSWMEPGPYTGRGPRGYTRSDERIREDICDRLTRHGRIDATDITIAVRNGDVTLDGIVDTRDAKRLAEDVAESVDGVREVTNHLKTHRGSDEASVRRESTGTAAGDTTSITGTSAVGSVERKR